MDLLGHSQIRTTLDVYTHVMPGLAGEAADRTGPTVPQRAKQRRLTAPTLESRGGGKSERTGKTPAQRDGLWGAFVNPPGTPQCRPPPRAHPRHFRRIWRLPS